MRTQPLPPGSSGPLESISKEEEGKKSNILQRKFVDDIHPRSFIMNGHA